MILPYYTWVGGWEDSGMCTPYNPHAEQAAPDHSGQFTVLLMYYMKFKMHWLLRQNPCKRMGFSNLSFILWIRISVLISYIICSNQMVICLSETSETRHDTRDQRESLRGRAPHPISGWNLGNFGKFWKILGNFGKFWEIYVHRKINAFWKFHVWITSFLLYLAKRVIFPSIMAYESLSELSTNHFVNNWTLNPDTENFLRTVWKK